MAEEDGRGATNDCFVCMDARAGGGGGGAARRRARGMRMARGAVACACTRPSSTTTVCTDYAASSYVESAAECDVQVGVHRALHKGEP